MYEISVFLYIISLCSPCFSINNVFINALAFADDNDFWCFITITKKNSVIRFILF